jgi:hypothetical protein
MNMKYLASAAVAALALSVAGVATAAPLTLTGNFVKVGVSDAGTLGSDGSTSPGLLHDPTGSGNFGVNDYITPGTPHDGFSVRSDQHGFLSNDNDISGGSFGSTSPTLLTGAAKLGFDNAATWTGSGGGLTVTNSYFFNNGDQRITVMTTLTATEDLTGVDFARSVDPDPDVNTFGSFSTNNQRGNALFGVTDFVGAAGPLTGLTLALLNLNGDVYAHNTEIDTNCCSNIDPLTVLAGSANSLVGDDGLNIAWNIGALTKGASATINYAYVVGEHIETAGGPGGGIPEPTSWAMMLLGFGGIGALLRARRRTAFAAA